MAIAFGQLKLISAILMVPAAFLFFARPALAGDSHNLCGYAWSELYGWVSINSNNHGGAIDYGVNVDGATGNLEGWAWNDLLGWISFATTSLSAPAAAVVTANCPNCVPNDPVNPCSACYNSVDDKYYGWAQVVALGDEGWIRLDDHDLLGQPDYGIYQIGDELHDWAWGAGDSDGDGTYDIGIGWVSFNCAEGAADYVSDYCTTVNYKISHLTSGVCAAPNTGNVTGYGWSDNFGWISFNSQNQGEAIPYGVNIDTGNGNISGWAWNDALGWISFATTTLPAGYDDSVLAAHCDASCRPGAAPPCTACYDRNDDRLYGWAQAITLGDDGWIRLDDEDPADGNDYGVSYGIDPAPDSRGELFGWAWGAAGPSTGIGWISFNCADGGPGGSNICGTSHYQGIVQLNDPPEVNLVTIADPLANNSPCGDIPLWMTLSWAYSDSDGDTQTAYHIQIQEEGGSWSFSDIKAELYYESDANTFQYYINNPLPDRFVEINFNTNYDYRVQVRDSNNASSTWVEYHTSTGDWIDTPAHDYPDAIFTWTPYNFSANEEVLYTTVGLIEQYTSGSAQPCPNIISNVCSYDWEKSPDDSTININPMTGTTIASSTKVVFTAPAQDNIITLTVTDSDNYSCSTSTTVRANYRLPSWIEWY